jgi:hypothetical protein
MSIGMREDVLVKKVQSGLHQNIDMETMKLSSKYKRSLLKNDHSGLSIFEYFFFQVWTNSDASSDVVSGKKPLAVYAQIIKGTSPVLNADVTLEIKITSKSGNDHNTTMKLYDNGRGGNLLFKPWKNHLEKIASF